MRADLAIVEAGLCDTRSQAQLLIKAGEVFLSGTNRAITKPSQMVPSPQLLEVRRSTPEFVSRGGIKLWHALSETELTIEGKYCLDFGQSTGGFTDCLIQAGAELVVGFDVGHGQLNAKLTNHPKVIAYEGVNLKTLDPQAWIDKWREEKSVSEFDIAVADLSFISLFKILPSVRGLLNAACECLFLIKPQFELGPEWIDKKGIIKKDLDTLEALKPNLLAACEEFNFRLNRVAPCKIKGGDGNQEYFAHLTALP